MGKNKKIHTPNVYNQWLALFRKDWEEKKDEREKNNYNKRKHKSKAMV
mgnify:CR=1 FL=1